MFDLIFRGVASLGAICGLIYWFAYSWHDQGDWLRSLVKTTALAPLALFWLATSLLAQEPVWIMALGLLLGAMGDLLLSRPGHGAFLAGMAAFGLGHLAYAGGLFHRSAELGFAPISGEQILAIALLVLLLLSTERWLAPRVGRLLWPLRLYAGLIATLALAAILLPPAAGSAALRGGAALFLISDLLLALRLFVLHAPPARALVGATLWPAYLLGQLSLFWGSLLFWTFPNP